MKIVFLHSGSDLYGASRCLVRLAAALQTDGHDAVVWIPQDGSIRPPLETAGVRCETVPELKPISRGQYARWPALIRYGSASAASAVTLARRLRAEQPDIVHTNTSVMPAAGMAARLAGRRHLLHVREWFGEFPRAWAAYRWYLFHVADRLVCVSRAVADQFPRSLRGRVRVIYDGFPLPEFDAVTPERTRAFRDAFGFGDRLLAGVVGRIKWKRKGQENFARAAALLRNAHPAARFVCVGSPFPGNEEHLEALRHLAAELELGQEWTVTGNVADNLGAVAALDILVHPPAQPEPFAGVVIEAMALGKPVVGTRVGGTAEQVEHERTGLLVPSGDPYALAAAIGRLFDDADLRREMGARGRERYLERFGWDSFYRSIQAEYSAILTAGFHR
jgi:glycosyltransferase involved in cell wall biosynthesis